jgi:dienelactone hydrolase
MRCASLKQGCAPQKFNSAAVVTIDLVQVVVAHLRSTGKVSTLGLWGRSMGAVTTLLYSNRDPSIAGIVSGQFQDCEDSQGGVRIMCYMLYCFGDTR